MKNQISKIVKALGIIALLTGVILPSFNLNTQTGNIAGLDNKNTAVTANTVTNLPWDLDKINADGAWKSTNGGTSVIVAVLDTGIDANHQGLIGKVIDNINFSHSSTSNDVNGHGTAVAGLIAASLENGKGTIGVAYNASLLNVKVADDSGIISPEAVAKGIIWAIGKGAKVINMSFTLRESSQTVEDAINYAWSKGAVLIAAGGNVPNSKTTYPASHPNVISVAGTDKNDHMSNWSCTGNWISVRAPNVDLYTTSPDGKYTMKSGTSFAAPLVSGEAALLLTIAKDTNDNGLTNDEVRAAILNNTDAGRIDILKAVESLK